MRFFRFLDDRDYEGLTSMLAEESEWHRQGKVLRGKQATLAALQARSPTMRIHHLLTNVLTHSAGDGEITVSAYMSVVRHEPGAAMTGASPLKGIESIRTIRARLRDTPQGWRIVHMGADEISFDTHA